MKYPSIRIEGAILSPDILERLEDIAGQRPADFGLETGAKVKDEIARAWADAQDYWRIFRRKLETLKDDSPATSETRNNWIVPLLSLFKYEVEYQKSGVELNGKTYAISHRIVNRGNTPCHIVGFNEPAGLDRKPANATLRMSAHAMMQEYLNLHEELYGIVINGKLLRLLRDSSRLVKQSYLEFDLDRIFSDGLFADFAALYRLLHASRLPATIEAAPQSLIERYHQDSLDSGARIRDGLSRAVERAILSFGEGFLSNKKNEALHNSVRNGTLGADDYYKSLLRLIYRLLFLMVIEERDLIFPAKTSRAQRDVYAKYYSVQRLRNLSEKRFLEDKTQSDLWLALRSTFRLFEAGGPGEKLGISPLAGDLFGPDAIRHLEDCVLSNDVLLKCLRDLSLYEHPDNGQTVRVNYAALNVEEFGSVYEGLLEYEPHIQTDGEHYSFSFKQGDERAATGSHYTPDDLVQPLITHSLDYLIEEKLKEKDPEKALLSLRVADISCGSGHILLAAARRIATELATVRTGEEQPSPSVFRSAIRDVIRECIYGVDLNPLAVELCKVALWLEAHNPGEPLNFLDHHIKCGNSIVGFVRAEEMAQGIPDEAFKTLPGDDKEVASQFRKMNKKERSDRNQTLLNLTNRTEQFKSNLNAVSKISQMPERTPEEIRLKQQRYTEHQRGDAWLLNEIAAFPIAQFYIPKTEANRPKICTDAQFQRYLRGEARPQGQIAGGAVGAAARKRFFHWFIEFPEIIERGGFDCILGNPPYLGGQALSGTYGHEFCEYVRHAYAPTGLSELVVYFLRRIYALITPGGFTAFITTNSIKDGDVRKDGLEQVVAAGGSINFAVRGVKWPGRANLVVSLVALHRGAWTRKYILDNRDVATITPFFEDSEDSAPPLNIKENDSAVFQGAIFLGDGFLLTDREAAELVRLNSRNQEVIQPIINGQELNNEPDQKPGRKIINFRDWSKDKAMKFSEPFSIIETKVQPYRSTQNRQRNRDLWWIYAEHRPGLTAKLRGALRCFAAARTTKHLSFSECPTDIVFSDALYVFTTDRWDLFSIGQSTIHEVWARKYSGSLETRLRYSPSDCFETYAFPADLWQTANSTLADIGERYHEHRRNLMLSLWLGLTDVYNLFHSKTLEADLKDHFASRAKKDPDGLKIPEEHRARALAFNYDAALAGILELRRLHIELDTAVRDTYGWQDLDLAHDFYEVETLPENDRVRYSISPAARKELLKRLLKLNHERAAEEAAAAAAVEPTAKKGKEKKGKPSRHETLSLFE
jgi:type I restriction-modification system DNA methylase subunit